MRHTWALIVLCLVLAAPAGPSLATYKQVPGYPGATPRTLCYEIVDMGELWKIWIETAVDHWNSAKTGWTFRPCAADEKPDIRFVFNYHGGQIAGGAHGYPRGGGKGVGNWEIEIDPDVSGRTINGKAIKGGVDGKGWRLRDEAGETTLDPVLVIGHELGHALGLDHDNTAKCDTGNLEEPICPGNHGNPTGRKPSANDIAEVKRGIALQQKKEADAAAGAPSPPPEPITPKDNVGGAALLEEINRARADPPGYARFLGAGDGEARAFLAQQAPVPPLVGERGLFVSAQLFATDLGGRGAVGHTGADGSTPRQRMQAQGLAAMLYAEEVSLGENGPRAVVRQLIVDAGVPGHMHRSDLFNPIFKFAGAGCGPHKAYRTLCVIDLTGARLAP